MTHATQELFTDRSRARLIALCTHLGGPDAAEDLVQETLLEAWRQSHKLTDPSGSDAWLAAIARNVWRRWSRASTRTSMAREAVLHEADSLATDDGADVELDRRELADVLDSALQLLPGVTREAVVRRFVDGSTHREIAARLGISADAVSMRISRGRLILQRALESRETELLSAMGLSSDVGSWRRTRLCCPICGKSAVDMRAGVSPPVLALRCTGCQPDGTVPSSVFALDNPTWAGLLEGLVRPSAVQLRASRFVHEYFNDKDGSDTVACSRCSIPGPIRAYERREEDLAHRRGIYTECRRCGEVASVSAAGRALAMPEVQAFKRAHRRFRLDRVRELESGGLPAIALSWRSLSSTASIDVLLTRDRLRPINLSASAN